MNNEDPIVSVNVYEVWGLFVCMCLLSIFSQLMMTIIENYYFVISAQCACNRSASASSIFTVLRTCDDAMVVSFVCELN